MSVPTIPESAPFTAEQRAWLNGYLAGLFARAESPVGAGNASISQALIPLTILYGTQTGTSESLAKQMAKVAATRQFVATVVDLAAVTAEMLTSAKNILVITSTYGDGEPPDNAKDFWASLSSDAFPRLTGIPFSVFALGDTNYEKFCQFGKDIDLRLEALGAKRVYDRFDTDVDYEEGFSVWSSGALAALGSIAAEGGIAPGTQQATVVPASTTDENAGYTKKNPFRARLKTNRLMSQAGSEKETRHFEILLDDTIQYEPGDALGVIPQNNPAEVARLIKRFNLNPQQLLEVAGGLSVEVALTELYDLKKIPENFSSESEFFGQLKKIQPRLYSISSSPKAHNNEVHLTVSVVRYEKDGQAHEGLCSTYLADRVGDRPLGVFVHRNTAFRLPADLTTPIIMVGPGTGIAPFRAFLEQRRATAASGKNLLFFGEQRSACDFYYRDELAAMVNDGFLTLYTAFSRDQQEKYYVQHRMMENAQQVYALLEQGAYFYVCGDASHMAKDVDAALHRIVEMTASVSAEEAHEYVQRLRTQKRYLRDVY